MNSQVKSYIEGEVWERGTELPFPLLGTPPSEHLHMFNNPKAPRALYFGDFYGDSITAARWILKSFSSSSLFSREWEAKLKVPSF